MWSASPTVGDTLPHRYPFQLLDRVIQCEAGHWAVATKCIGFGDECLDETGTIPPALLLECLAQAAGLAAAIEAGQGAMVAAVDRFRARTAQVGDQLVVFARVVKRYGQTAKVRAYARRQGRWVGAADLVMRLG